MASSWSSGPTEGSNALALPKALRVKILRSSLRYLLIHHLGHRYRYTTKKPTFSDSKKRHTRNRKFIIEMDSLHLLNATYVAGKFVVLGDYVNAFTDETYIHQTTSL